MSETTDDRSPPVRLKVCCIASPEEARLAIRSGATAVGLVSAMPSGPGPIDEPLIRDIAAQVPAGIETFLLTSLTDPQAIIAQHARCRTSTLQLVDRVAPETLTALRSALPEVRLVQVIHVQGPAAIEEALRIERRVDAILLDSGNPALAVKELGGTGRTHDWSVSRELCAAVNVPVYLAGGLRPDNVVEAVTKVRPFGVDVCSGLRTRGALDERKLGAFTAALWTIREPRSGA